jgi:hypothetical protein
MKVTIELTGEQVTDLLAQLGVADPVHSRPSGQESGGCIGLLTAAEVAKRLNIGREFLYDHAAEYGGFKVGREWRFDPAKITKTPSSAEGVSRVAPRRRAVSVRDNSPLLEVRGDSPYAG